MEFDMIVGQRRLYKRGAKGEIRVWFMELGAFADDPLNKEAGHRVVSSVLHGKETRAGWTIGKPKNVGKSNATNSHQQAEAEIAAEYQKKLDRGYFEDIESVDKIEFVKPMLAQDWAKRGHKVDLSEGVYAQPKLDGIRCIARADGLWTRQGKPVVHFPLIVAALAPVFARNPEMVFDGELYNHDLREDFNKITSAVRKAKPSEKALQESAQLIEYHIYDMVDEDAVFSRRNSALTTMLNQDPHASIKIVQTKKVESQETLDALYGRWMQEGYEGQMVRRDVEYENKRSSSLLKRKEFITEEFPVRAIHEGEGNWSGAIKRFTLALPSGVEFGAGVRGKYEDLEELFKGTRIPKWATLRYFNLTPDGVPRFPVVIDYGFEDKRED